MRFESRVELGGKTATGIEVPPEVIDQLGTSRRPPVTVTINGYTYRTTAVRMGGRFLVPLAAENREAAGVQAGDEVVVGIENDTAPREVELPADLDAAMDDAARATYDGLSYTHRKEWVRWVEEAKRPETRATRIEKTVAGLHEGRKTHKNGSGSPAAANCAYDAVNVCSPSCTPVIRETCQKRPVPTSHATSRVPSDDAESYITVRGPIQPSTWQHCFCRPASVGISRMPGVPAAIQSEPPGCVAPRRGSGIGAPALNACALPLRPLRIRP
jgi:hypothetical protein